MNDSVYLQALASLRDSLRIVAANSQGNDWWKYLSAPLSALLGYLGGLATPATLNRIKFRSTRKKVHVFPDNRTPNYFGIRLHNASHYRVRNVAAYISLGYLPADIVSRVSGSMITNYNRSIVTDQRICWSISPSSACYLVADLNPGESQFLLLFKEYYREGIQIASEFGFGDSQEGPARVELKNKSYDGVLKVVGEDIFPAFFDVCFRPEDSTHLLFRRISESEANAKEIAFKRMWDDSLAVVVLKEELSERLAKKQREWQAASNKMIEAARNSSPKNGLDKRCVISGENRTGLGLGSIELLPTAGGSVLVEPFERVLSGFPKSMSVVGKEIPIQTTFQFEYEGQTIYVWQDFDVPEGFDLRIRVIFALRKRELDDSNEARLRS